MIHGIYLRSKPKSVWHLYSVSMSAEIANNDLTTALEQSISQGNDKAEAVVQVFDSGFYIPELIHNIKEKRSTFN